MVRMTLREALRRYGGTLSLAALGAIEKKGETDEVRVIFDATHGVLTNYQVRVRDLVRNPTAQDLKAVMSEFAGENVPHFSLVYDVSHTHRRVPVEIPEWGRLGCQIQGTAARTFREAAEQRKKAEADGGRASGVATAPPIHG